jgi:hypothetical protein
VLLRGCTAGNSKPGGQLSPEALEVVRKARDVAEMGLSLTESDFSILPASVRAELLKSGIVEKRQAEGRTGYFFVLEKVKPYLS